ncbi:MAG TPA: hypothetical protein VH115_01875, partial [Solirubrobacteraceae bacterium]|nr:hypothetical protein [Solirubrobacteraceae bacterium]
MAERQAGARKPKPARTPAKPAAVDHDATGEDATPGDAAPGDGASDGAGILFVGDLVGGIGRRTLLASLPVLRERYAPT